MKPPGFRLVVAGTLVALVHDVALAWQVAHPAPNEEGRWLEVLFGVVCPLFILALDALVIAALARDHSWRRGIASARAALAVPIVLCMFVVVAAGVFFALCDVLGVKGSPSGEKFNQDMLPWLGIAFPPFVSELLIFWGCVKAARTNENR